MDMTGQRQPLYASALPKPCRALKTSRDLYCSSSPDRSPERPAVLASPTSLTAAAKSKLQPTEKEGALSLPSFELQGNNCTPASSSGMYGQHQQVARYKQYTNSNITPAIEAVKSGVMNALQASKEFKVPHSTLYSKVKKLDIATPPYDITTRTKRARAKEGKIDLKVLLRLG